MVEPETGPEAAKGRESRRVTGQLQNEAKRVACWDKLQREVLRRSTSEVTELLMADGLRQVPVEAGCARARGGSDSIQVNVVLARRVSCETDRRDRGLIG